MKELLTSNSHVVLLDDIDYENVSRWRWSAVRKHDVWYAIRNIYVGGGREHRKVRRVYMHRLLIDAPKGMQVDHKNGNGLDNRRDNLRATTHQINQRNRAGPQSNSKSGVNGVYWHKQRGKWAAMMRISGKNIPLGLYASIEQAAAARKVGEQKYWQADDNQRKAALAAAPTSERSGK